MAEHRAGQLPSSKRKHALSGLVRCAGCGGAMHRGGQCKSTGMVVRFNCRRVTCPQLNRNGIREDVIWQAVAARLLEHRQQIAGLLLGQVIADDAKEPAVDAAAMARLTDQRSQLLLLQEQGLPVADALTAVDREIGALRAAAAAGQGETARALAQLGQEVLGGDAGGLELMEGVIAAALVERYPAPLADDWTAALVRTCVRRVVIDRKQVAGVEVDA